ncbi:MAG TPA: type II toxin-antitoxin system VapC family toxin [Stellaceae bacterium]|nr:type II toxin-antitoxin system VapC family toxin [Stellaceae bacterium]
MILDTSAIVATISGEPEGSRFQDAMLRGPSLAISAVTAAFDAFQCFGKGQGHPAQLDIVDCAAYALARIRGEPLLFKGSDFEKTDLQSAL